jgi:prephenate dehydrogenase
MVVVTRTEQTDPSALAETGDFWRQVGARVEVMSPESHDAMLASTSHLPHIVAAALVNAVLGGEGRRRAAFCGPGFRDTTRIAAGSEVLWHDIVRSNSEAVESALAEFSVEIERVLKALREGRFEAIRAFLAEARERRGHLSSATTAGGES